MNTFRIFEGDALERLRELPDESVHCCVTSPPYWGLRDYGVDEQIGLECSPEEYTARVVEIFRGMRRVLRADGTAWVNMGDSYTSGGRASFGTFQPDTKQASHPAIKSARRAPQPPGLKPKDLVGIPWRIAFALQADGWYLRSDIIWAKPNPMPESVTDRPTKAHEYIFLLTKSERYHYDREAILEPLATDASGNYVGRNKRTVWTIPTQPYPEAHFATYPEELIRPCILAGCPEGGIVLDPFCGSGTTGVVACGLGREFIGIELNAEYAAMARRRISGDMPLFNVEERPSADEVKTA